MTGERMGGLHVFAESFDTYQPAQSAQADMSRNFSLYLNFLLVKGQYSLCFSWIIDKKVDFLWIHKFVMYGTGIMDYWDILILYYTIPTFDNFVGKGENADNQHFFPFPTMFSTLSITNFNSLVKIIIIMSSANAFSLNQFKIFVVW